MLCGEIVPHDINEKTLCTIYAVTLRNHISLSQLTLFCYKICFVAIYAVLSRNLFCRDLRPFVWRKIEPKIVPVEKKDKYQVWW